MIDNPLEAYLTEYQQAHLAHTSQLFEELVQKSGINIEENQETVAQYDDYSERLAQAKKKRKWRAFFRVLMCITIILIPIVIWKLNPIIKQLDDDIQESGSKANEFLEKAKLQMLPLCRLFDERDSYRLIEKTIPSLIFDERYSASQEANMAQNFGFAHSDSKDISTTDVLAGSYNENPFLYERRLIHTMGTKQYEGSLTISWTETRYDSNGRPYTEHKSQTLTATVTKPMPYYNSQLVLNYCAQEGEDLTFSRAPGHVEKMSERDVESHITKGERKLKKESDKALRTGSKFTPMANTTFEVLFNAINRSNEIQFRALFTPLAQTNMAKLLRSKDGHGDDFHFFKSKCVNQIVSQHSQNMPLQLHVSNYASHSFHRIKENFLQKNAIFFKSIYFDFAPLWAIPAYHERPVHSLKELPPLQSTFSLKEGEVLANAMAKQHVVHPDTKTSAILKASPVASRDKEDIICVTAYSYDIIRRITYVSVRGGDGYYHDVPVEWDEYIPLEAKTHLGISTNEDAAEKAALATHGGLSIYKQS